MAARRLTITITSNFDTLADRFAEAARSADALAVEPAADRCDTGSGGVLAGRSDRSE